MSTLYETLGVQPGATQDEIKRAYRAKANACHPDHGGDPEEFAELAKAYEVLSDPERRTKYDEFGETELDDKFAIVTSTVAALAVQAFSISENPVQWICDHVDRQRNSNRGNVADTNRQIEQLERRLSKFVEVNDSSLEAVEVIKNSIESKLKLLRMQAEELQKQADLGTEILTYLNGLKRGRDAMDIFDGRIGHWVPDGATRDDYREEVMRPRRFG